MTVASEASGTPKEVLMESLRKAKVADEWDMEVAHLDADKALLAFINDPEVTEAYEAIDRWYA